MEKTLIEESVTETVTALSGLTNREIAAVLFNIATLLREQGNENPFRTAAYERGARAMMGYRNDAREILAVGEKKKLPFREAWHIGKKLQAKIREMAASSALAQFGEMLETQSRHRREMVGLPGIGPKTADRIHAALGIETAEELFRAAHNGRLRQVRGFGKKRIAQIAACAPAEIANSNPTPKDLSLFSFGG
jgi:DNA polymerase (family 10)